MKSIFHVILSVAILSPINAWACSVPKIGPEYDSLIHVEKIDHNKFKATVSIIADDLEYGASFRVIYKPSKSEKTLDNYWKDIQKQEMEGKYVAVLNLKNINGYATYLQVYWYPESWGLCGAYGESEELQMQAARSEVCSSCVRTLVGHRTEPS